MISSLLLSQEIWNACVYEAASKYPLESGGLFLGTQEADGVALATDMIGPGPGAIHSRRSLEFDHEWQNAKIAALYAASGRRIGFLGEWHTHPDAHSGTMSTLDKATLLELSIYEKLRAPDAVMAILFGRGAEWQAEAWRIESAKIALGTFITIHLARVRFSIS